MSRKRKDGIDEGVDSFIEELADTLTGSGRSVEQIISDLEDAYVSATGGTSNQDSEYEFVPVDINTFIDDPQYLGGYFDGVRGKGEYNPYWRKRLNWIFPNKLASPYWLVALRGSIGRGKTTFACTCMAYDVYRLIGKRTPQEDAGLVASTIIIFAIFNVTKSQASDAGAILNQMMIQSPWFRARLNVRSRWNKQTLLPKNIDFAIGSRVHHGQGKAVYDALLDESDFEIVDNQVYNNFNTLLRRIQSRFGAGFPGRLYVVSSEGEKFSVINRIVESYRGDPGIFVDRSTQWEVMPEKCPIFFATGETFAAFKGSTARKPYIVSEDGQQNSDPIWKEQPERIIQVPIDLLKFFKADIYSSLRDMAGEPLVSKYRLFNQHDRLIASLVVTPIFPSVFTLDFYDKHDLVQNYADKPGYFKNPLEKGYPRHIHIDIALNGDRLGFASSLILRYGERKYIDPTTLEETTQSVPEILTEFAFAIEAKPGQQIPLFKVRAFIQFISAMGFSIGFVSCDGYQCLVGDTRVPTTRGLLPISEVRRGDMVQSRSGPRKVLKTWAFKKTNVFKIVTSSGSSIVATAKHRIEVAMNYRIHPYQIHQPGLYPPEWGWVRVHDLRFGDVVRVADALDLDSSEIPLPYVSKRELGCGYNNTTSGDSWNPPTHLTANLARFVGLMFADGSLCHSRGNLDGIRLSCHIDELEDYQKTCFDLFGFPWKIGNRRGKSSSLSLSSRWIARWFEFVGLGKPDAGGVKGGAELHIPDLVWKAPRRVQAAFLCGLFSGDGSVSLRDGKVVLGAKSKDFLTGVKTILQSFGMRSVITRRVWGRYVGYVLSISGSRGVFLEEVGFLVGTKQGRLQKMRHVPGRVLQERITSITAAGRRDVYDLSIEGDPSYMAHGFVNHNSADMLQQLKLLGYETAVVSVDKTSEQYVTFRNAVYEGQWAGPKSPTGLKGEVVSQSGAVLWSELTNLEITPDGKKVDHPIDKMDDGTKPSKDISDSICGTYTTLSAKAPEYAMLYIKARPEYAGINTNMVDFFWGQKGRK